MRKEHGLGEDLIKGAIAGAVATWVMGKVTSTMYRREDRWARRREDDARAGKSSYGVAAEKVGTGHGHVAGPGPEREDRRRGPLGAGRRGRRSLRRRAPPVRVRRSRGGARVRHGVLGGGGRGAGAGAWASRRGPGHSPGRPMREVSPATSPSERSPTERCACSTRWPKLFPSPATAMVGRDGCRRLASASRMIRPCSAACAAGYPSAGLARSGRPM